jgi:class 3 adenylate cyclase
VAASTARWVLVSQTTRDLVEGSGLGLEDRGVFTLKGIEGGRRLYAASA